MLAYDFPALMNWMGGDASMQSLICAARAVSYFTNVTVLDFPFSMRMWQQKNHMRATLRNPVRSGRACN